MCGAGQLSNRALGRTETSFPLSSAASEVMLPFKGKSAPVSDATLTLLWKRSAKDRGYFHCSGQEATDQHCFIHAYTHLCLVLGDSSSSFSSVPFTQHMLAEASLDFKTWWWSSFSLFFNLCPDKLPHVQNFLVFSTSLSFGTWLFVSGSTTDESGFWLTLHKKWTVNSCWDLGRQRYARPSSDVIFTAPLSEYVMLSSPARLGHFTSKKSMKISWIERRK